jgi:hypothetical protein
MVESFSSGSILFEVVQERGSTSVTTSVMNVCGGAAKNSAKLPMADGDDLDGREATSFKRRSPCRHPAGGGSPKGASFSRLLTRTPR